MWARRYSNYPALPRAWHGLALNLSQMPVYRMKHYFLDSGILTKGHG